MKEKINDGTAAIAACECVTWVKKRQKGLLGKHINTIVMVHFLFYRHIVQYQS